MIGKYATIWQCKSDNGKLLNLVAKVLKKATAKGKKLSKFGREN